jgi:hypothetical protein
VKKLIPLTLALTLACSAVMAGTPDPPIPTCDCEVCALDGDQTCQHPWTGIYYICGGYYATFCSAG